MMKSPSENWCGLKRKGATQSATIEIQK